MSSSQQSLADQIRQSETTRRWVETTLSTDERVLARITDGIYRQPASALRELISNAYDADATEVIILTDAPRFSEIAVRDNGRGLSPEILEHLILHIGGSPKRSDYGKFLGVAAPDNSTKSPGGRTLIGKLGIGLFSVAQFTHHFLIITKTAGDKYRTVADITLGLMEGQTQRTTVNEDGRSGFTTGHARIWREHAEDVESQGTEIKLLDLLPRTRAELASEDIWTRVASETDDPQAKATTPPRLHIGRMTTPQGDVLDHQPQLPWTEADSPDERFCKFVGAVRASADTHTGSVDLETLCDHYLQTLWTLALAAPLEYFQVHPFDLRKEDGLSFFELENAPRGQATNLPISGSETARKSLKLQAPDGTFGQPFKVFIDGMRLRRPILYLGLPRTANALQTPLLFVGRHQQHFEGKPRVLSGGSLSFEAYLFWAPKIVPKQHQGVVLRVGNASGSLFDRTFMGYQIQEQQRTRQLTAEIFVHEGLDDALNLDRESFNYAHPHYQYLVKWLHSALRQFANKHKELGAALHAERVAAHGLEVRTGIDDSVAKALKERGVEDVPKVVLADVSTLDEAGGLRSEGAVVLRRDVVLPPSGARRGTRLERDRRHTAGSKAMALAQLLHGWGLMDTLTYGEQEKLIRDILEIMMVEAK